MTSVRILRDSRTNVYGLYLCGVDMGVIKQSSAKNFIDRYPHVKPQMIADHIEEWSYTNP